MAQLAVFRNETQKKGTFLVALVARAMRISASQVTRDMRLGEHAEEISLQLGVLAPGVAFVAEDTVWSAISRLCPELKLPPRPGVVRDQVPFVVLPGSRRGR